jgi:hypothetical protein
MAFGNIEGDLEKDLARAAGEIAADAAQKLCDGDLRKAKSSTIYSAMLYKLSASVSIASDETRKSARAALAEVLARSAGRKQTAAKSITQSAIDIAQRLISEPKSPSNLAALEGVREISLRYASSDDVIQASKGPQYRRSSKQCRLEPYSKSITTGLHNLFYGGNYLPCTCPGKSGAFHLSAEYECALRLDGYQHVSGTDDHCFFESVIAKKGDKTHYWTPVQFHLPRSVDRYTDP